MGVSLARWCTIAVASAWIAGCGLEYPAPEVLAVQPSRGWNGEDTVLAISGNNFFPQVWVEAGKADKARVDDGFTAYLVSQLGEEFELSGSINGYDRMDAVVKAGLSPGLYDVVVEAPNGSRGALADGFRVTDTVADRLVLDNAVPSEFVDNAIGAGVYLADPTGEPVFEVGFAVDIWLEDAAGQPYPEASFLSQAIDTSGVSQPGHLTGVLRDVVVPFSVRVEDPGVYTLHADPQREAGVAGDSVVLQWEAGVLDAIRIELPTPDFQVAVGVPFDVSLTWVDLSGNPIKDYSDIVFLQSVCSGFLTSVEVLGTAVVSITLDTPCDEDEIFSGLDSAARSPIFEVLAGPPDHLEVALQPGPVIAGEVLDVVAVVHDSLHNPVSIPGSVGISLDIGGMLSSSCTASPFGGGVYFCTGTPTIAASPVVLTAATDTGVSGDSSPFTVLANAGSIGSVEVEILDQPVAGEPFGIALQPVDSWGNPVDAAAFSGGDWAVDDGLSESICSYVGVAGDGRAEFDCTLFTARDDATLEAQLLPAGVSGQTPDFPVLNGVLDRVVVTVPNGAAVQAGTPFQLDLAGFDAWDNPALVLVDPTVDLSDDTETISPATATLGGSGTAQVQVTLFAAGSTAIHAEQLGTPLGSSPGLTVTAAPTAGLRVTPLNAPWAWVGQATTVRVEAVDPWGNRTGWSGSVDLSSRNTASPPVVVGVTNGVGSAGFTWTQPALDEILDASTASWSGESALLDVVSDCGPTGPVVALDFGGFPEALACVDPGTGLGPANASFAGSVQGNAALSRYDLFVEGLPVVRSAVSGLVFDLPGSGIHAIRGLVIDAAGCGSEVSATGYAGPDDGEPVGPIEIAPTTGSIVAGLGSTAVDLLGITDCSRDPALGGTVLVRSAMGEILGAAPTGAGLGVQADASGEARVTLDAIGAATAGDAALVAWVPSGAAEGAGSVAITGDNLRPEVWGQDPVGEALFQVDEIELVFSEALSPDLIVPTNFSVTGPSAVVVVSAVLDPSDSVVTVVLDRTVDGAAGAWTVTANSQIRDAAGNRLSGDWSGSAASYVGSFGAVGAAVDPVSCDGTQPASGTFRPDGDDGALEESDWVAVSVSTAAAPAWWEVTVAAEPGGAPFRLDRVVPSGATDDWAWDGRDADGRVVDNGAYRIEVSPVDGVGNRGTPCSEVVVVDNPFGVAP